MISFSVVCRGVGKVLLITTDTTDSALFRVISGGTLRAALDASVLRRKSSQLGNNSKVWSSVLLNYLRRGGLRLVAETLLVLVTRVNMLGVMVVVVMMKQLVVVH